MVITFPKTEGKKEINEYNLRRRVCLVKLNHDKWAHDLSQEFGDGIIFPSNLIFVGYYIGSMIGRGKKWFQTHSGSSTQRE